MAEIHLFIIWEKGRSKEKEIIDDIKKRLKVLSVIKIQWSPDKFAENLTRFYGKNLPSSSDKIKECGKGEFVLIVVKDSQPLYRPRKTTKGVKMVNINIFDSKEMYRYWTGGGVKVHATNSEAELNHDLTLLTGMNGADFESYVKKNKNYAYSETKDIVGAYEWDSFDQVLYVLNNCSEYIILRNFEELPEHVTIGKHGDIDFLVSDRDQFRMILNSKPVFRDKLRVRETIHTMNGELFCDIRSIGDGYYDEQWEKHMLSCKKFNSNGFYTSCDEDLFYSLLYHAVIQKKEIASDYVEKIHKYSVGVLADEMLRVESRSSCLNLLCTFLKNNGYMITEPSDPSVTFNVIGTDKKLTNYYRLKKLLYRGKRKLKMT